MGFLAGKRILITGLISNRSIAYGIAKACHREGAELAFTYQNERFKDRMAKYADEFGSTAIYPCDVSQDAEIVEIGNGETRRVIKLKTLENIVVYVNGTITATNADTPHVARVIEVTRARRSFLTVRLADYLPVSRKARNRIERRF